MPDAKFSAEALRKPTENTQIFDGRGEFDCCPCALCSAAHDYFKDRHAGLYIIIVGVRYAVCAYKQIFRIDLFVEAGSRRVGHGFADKRI